MNTQITTPEITSQYQEISLLGKGAYGSVFLVKDIKTNIKYAIKRIASPLQKDANSRLIKQSLCELEILSHLNHKNIIQLKESFLSADKIIFLDQENQKCESKIYLTLEYYPFDLRQLIYSPAYLYRDQVRKIMFEILQGLAYLHANKIIHRDVKPGNVLGNHKGEYCLCDFSLSRGITTLKKDINNKMPEIISNSGDEFNINPEEICENSVDLKPIQLPKKSIVKTAGFTPKTNSKSKKFNVLTKHVTTRHYRAPEVILVENYDTAVDIWGAGCIFAELLQTIKKVKSDWHNRKPIFLGEYCFPLSPPPRESMKEEHRNGAVHVFPHENDQLAKIVQTLGFPSEKSMSFVQNYDAKAYLEKLREVNEKGIIDDLVPQLELHEKDLLMKMLEFNPELRITAKDALKHEYFNGMQYTEIKEIQLKFETENKEMDKFRILNKYCTK